MKKFFGLLFLLILIISSNTVLAEDTTYAPSEKGVVQEIEYVDIDNDGFTQVKQSAQVKVLSGKFKGEIVNVDNMLTGNPYYDINLRKGLKVILHVEENNGFPTFAAEDISRSPVILWLSLIFCSFLIYVGRKKGLYSLVSIIITGFLIFNVLSPMILHGINPIFGTILVCLLSTAVTMYLVGGFNKKSTAATFGCVLSIIFAGVLSFLTVKLASLSGFTNEQTVFLYSAHPELNFVLILISAMLLATLGAVMDVAMSIASTINEINEVDSSKSVKELFVCGMNVGRDIIGTMANTLILVYLGGSLPLLLLASNIDLMKFINLNQVVTEISSALIGSIAIVICVPITAIVASELVKKSGDNKKIDKIEI